MSAKVLVLDIERLIGKFEGEFWDPYAMKNRRIPPQWVTRDPRSICFAWKWEGERKTDFISEWGEGPEAMAHKAFDLYVKADVVVGHNIKGFDSPHLQGLCDEYGLRLPKVQHQDTLLIARKTFNFEYNHLDVLCKRFGIKGKVDKYDPQVAEDAVNGDVKAQKRIERYNRGDVSPASEKLGQYLRPYSGINFAAFTSNGGRACPSCSSTHLQSRGQSVTKSGFRYNRYQCQACGAWSQERKNANEGVVNELRPA